MYKVFIILFFMPINLFSYENSSKFWSTDIIGPTSIEEAIETFFLDRNLDPIEGIWTESNWGLVAIVKDGFIYKKYVLGVRFANLNGTHETTIIPTAMEGIFTILTRISWEDGDFYKFKTSPGTYVFYNDDIIERVIDKYALHPYGYLIRNWPLNINGREADNSLASIKYDNYN